MLWRQTRKNEQHSCCYIWISFCRLLILLHCTHPCILLRQKVQFHVNGACHCHLLASSWPRGARESESKGHWFEPHLRAKLSRRMMPSGIVGGFVIQVQDSIFSCTLPNAMLLLYQQQHATVLSQKVIVPMFHLFWGRRLLPSVCWLASTCFHTSKSSQIQQMRFRYLSFGFWPLCRDCGWEVQQHQPQCRRCVLHVFPCCWSLMSISELSSRAVLPGIQGNTRNFVVISHKIMQWKCAISGQMHDMNASESVKNHPIDCEQKTAFFIWLVQSNDVLHQIEYRSNCIVFSTRTKTWVSRL